LWHNATMWELFLLALPFYAGPKPGLRHNRPTSHGWDSIGQREPEFTIAGSAGTVVRMT
jgi:hypothetical protein